jgi:hypothetical protein
MMFVIFLAVYLSALTATLTVIARRDVRRFRVDQQWRRYCEYRESR